MKDKEIRLGKGSFIKLCQRDRLEFLPFIKETLENPNVIVKQVDGALIFAKDFNDKKFFTSIARDYNNAWIIVSNAPKSENGLNNKIKEGGSVLFGELPERPIIAKPELTDKALNIEANSNNILPLFSLEQPKPKTTSEVKARDSRGVSSAQSQSNDFKPLTSEQTLQLPNLKESFEKNLAQAQELWLKTFNLKSLDEEFNVEIPQEISQKIGKEIKLNLNDLTKIIKNNRAKYIPEIKETFSQPQVVFIDEKGDLIFAKTLKEKIFFVNVSRDYTESFKGLSLAPKKEANLINKLEHAKEVIYNALDSKLRDSTAQQAFTDVLSSANKSNSDILPQKTSDSLTKQEESLRALLTNFKEANTAYADIKKRLNDKLTKAIFLDKPKKSTINSMRSIEEWKNAVLDKQWVNSIQGLENTIFAKFNPQMQEATQTLMIFRALEKHIKTNDGISTINLTKALKDIESLEALPLHPKAQNALNIFKELANIYQFANKISGVKGYKSASGNGALSTTLEGRARVFLTNRLFKILFFRVPYVGDKDAVLFHLKKAVQELKYPRAITLDILDNPTFTTPSPKSPINPKGEAFINDEVKRDISEFASNESVLKDEIIHKRAEIESQNTELLSAGEVLQALQKDKVIYSKVGSGSVTKEDLEQIQSILKELERREGIIADFGINYPEFYHKGAEAVRHLLSTKEGQVQGAFYRDDLGDIDLVWGKVLSGNRGYGLAHILDKHPEVSPKLLEEIAQKGTLEAENNINTLWLKKDEEYYKIGLTKGYEGKGENHWIITAYQVTREKDKRVGDALFTNRQPLFNPSKEKPLSLSTASDFTKGETLPFNSKEIITQQELKHNTPKVFNMEDIKINDYDDFLYYAKLAGFDLSKDKNAKEIHKALLAQIDKLEC